jgi:hypothetical protein
MGKKKSNPRILEIKGQPGERKAVDTVVALAAKHGYGNLIQHLKRAWALYFVQAGYAATYVDALVMLGFLEGSLPEIIKWR